MHLHLVLKINRMTLLIPLVYCKCQTTYHMYLFTSYPALLTVLGYIASVAMITFWSKPNQQSTTGKLALTLFTLTGTAGLSHLVWDVATQGKIDPMTSLLFAAASIWIIFFQFDFSIRLDVRKVFRDQTELLIERNEELSEARSTIQDLRQKGIARLATINTLEQELEEERSRPKLRRSTRRRSVSKVQKK